MWISNARGFATLLLTVAVLFSVTAIAFFNAETVVQQQQISSNDLRNQEAFSAAQAGLDYGAVYLAKNRSTITDNQVVTGSLTNGGTYSIRFAFKNGNNVVQIISTGASTDGITSKQVNQIMSFVNGGSGQTFNFSTNMSAKTRGTAVLRDNALVVNTEGASTINTGAGISFNGNAMTVLNSGMGSSQWGIKADIAPNQSSLASLSNDALQIYALGGNTIQNLQNSINKPASPNYVYSGEHQYNTQLNGVTGQVVWIQQNVGSGYGKIQGDTIVGSASAPVQLYVSNAQTFQLRENARIYGDLIVTGDLILVQNTIVYGNIIATGNVTLVDNAQVNGGVITGGDLSMQNNAHVRGFVFAQGNTHVTGNAILDGGFIGGGEFRVTINGHVVFNSDYADFNLTTLSTGNSGYGIVAGSWSDMAVN